MRGHIGPGDAIVKVAGGRSPCKQSDWVLLVFPVLGFLDNPNWNLIQGIDKYRKI